MKFEKNKCIVISLQIINIYFFYVSAFSGHALPEYVVRQEKDRRTQTCVEGADSSSLLSPSSHPDSQSEVSHVSSFSAEKEKKSQAERRQQIWIFQQL